MENAAHVGMLDEALLIARKYDLNSLSFFPGLYSPGGNNPRHDSRRRRSRFDRGTRFAQMEEANIFNPVDFPRMPMFPRLPGVPETTENQDQLYGSGPMMSRGSSQGFHQGGDDGPRSNFLH